MKFNYMNFCICLAGILLASYLVNPAVGFPTMIIVGVIAGLMFPYFEDKDK